MKPNILLIIKYTSTSTSFSTSNTNAGTGNQSLICKVCKVLHTFKYTLETMYG